MIVTKPQLAQAVREALYLRLWCLPSEKKAADPETTSIRKTYESAIMQEVHRLLQELDPAIEPPDITNSEEVSKFIEDLSRRDFRVNYTT